MSAVDPIHTLLPIVQVVGSPTRSSDDALIAEWLGTNGNIGGIVPVAMLLHVQLIAADALATIGLRMILASVLQTGLVVFAWAMSDLREERACPEI